MSTRVQQASPIGRVAANAASTGVLLKRRSPCAVAQVADARQSEGEARAAHGANFGHDFSNIPVGGGKGHAAYTPWPVLQLRRESALDNPPAPTLGLDAGHVKPVRPPNVEAQRGGNDGGLNPTFRPRNPRQPQPRAAAVDAVYSCLDPGPIHQGVAEARRQLRNVVPRLVAFRDSLVATPGAAPAPSAAPSAEQQIVRGALNTNFHTTAQAEVTAIVNNFINLQFLLTPPLTFRCTPACDPGDLAYVYRGARLPTGETAGDIYICPGFGTCNNPFKVPGVFIHERAHQALSARDHAYEFEANYSTLTPQLARANADSYAVAVRQIFYNGAHGPGERC